MHLISIILYSVLASSKYLSTYIALIAVLINLITLVVVIRQTRYTSETLKKTNESFEASKIVYQLKNLPKANLIIKVQMYLNNWKQELIDVVNIINSNENDKNKIEKVVEKAPKSSKLIDKYSFELMPLWLQELWMIGARYYYNSACLIKDMLDKETLTLKKDSTYYKERFEESIDSISKIEKYIEEAIPDVYLHSPADSNDESYFL